VPDDQTSRRLVLVELSLVTLGVCLCVGLATFLDSQAGRRAFVAGATELAERGDSGSRDGLVLEGRAPRRTSAELGIVPFAPGRTYLLVVRAGPGGPFKIVGRHGPSDYVREFNLGSRREPLEMQWLLEGDDLPEQLFFRAYYRGGADLAVEAISVGRILPVYFLLRPVVSLLVWLLPIAFLVRHRRRLGRGLRVAVPGGDATFALLIFGVCFFVFHSGTVLQVIDSRYTTAVSYSVLHGNGVTMPEGLAHAEGKDLRRQIERVGEEDRLVPFYSPMTAILEIPFVAGYELFGVSPATAQGGWDRSRETRILRFSAAFLSATLCVVLYGVARGFLPPGLSLGLVFAFAFGTQILSTLSRPYWTHTWGALLTALAILLTIRPWPNLVRLSAGIAVTCSSVAFFCRPQTMFSVLALVAFLAMTRRWRQLRWFIGVGALWAGLGLVLSLVIYETALPSYFFSKWADQGRFEPWRFDLRHYATGVTGMLISPGRGLLIYVPFVAWIVAVTLRRWQRLASRPLAMAAFGTIVAHGWLLAQTSVWAGGQSYGARQLSDVLVWFFVLGVLAVQVVAAEWSVTKPAKRFWLVGSLAVLLAFSIFVNARGAYAKATWRWNAFDRPPDWALHHGRSRFDPPFAWNWRYPQFMAGLLRHDLEEKLQEREARERLEEAGKAGERPRRD
jgi:hypothetical protein